MEKRDVDETIRRLEAAFERDGRNFDKDPATGKEIASPVPAVRDMKTPLNMIISTAGELLSTDLDETQRRYARNLSASARQLLLIHDRLVNDVPPKTGGSVETRTGTAGGFSEPDAPPLSGLALIVEDNRVNRMLIGTFLEKFGLTHDAVENGRQAVEAVMDKTYDLILMDVMMPVMDGIAATKQIRALKGPGADTPIIALTANAMRGDRENYLDAGMDAYVSKPIDVDELFKVVAGQLEDSDDRRLAATKSTPCLRLTGSPM